MAHNFFFASFVGLVMPAPLPFGMVHTVFRPIVQEELLFLSTDYTD